LKMAINLVMRGSKLGIHAGVRADGGTAPSLRRIRSR
jgi:hypothetical protein